MSPESTPEKHFWRPSMTGMVVSLAVAAILVAAALDGEPPPFAFLAGPGVAIVLGAVVTLVHMRQLSSVLWGTICGVAFGIYSSWWMLGQGVAEVFAVVAATLALFTTIGFIVGAFIEFVQLLHFMAHGGRVQEYRRQ